MRSLRRLDREEVSLLRALFSARLDRANQGVANFYVLEEIFIMDLEVSMFEFPCLEVRAQMYWPYPISIWIHTAFFVVPHFMKVVPTSVSSDKAG